MHAAHRFLAFTVLALGLSACGGGSDPEFTVTASAGTGGSITPGSRTVSEGNTTTFTVSASDGYLLDTVSGCGGTLEGATYTTGPITANCEVQASFERPLAISVSAPSSINENSTAMLSVSTSGASGSANISATISSISSGGSATTPTLKKVDGGYEIQVGEVHMRRPQYQVNVTVQKGGQTKTEYVDIELVSVTGDYYYHYALAVRDAMKGQHLFLGEQYILNQLARVAQIDGADVDMDTLKMMVATTNTRNTRTNLPEFSNHLYSGTVDESALTDYAEGFAPWTGEIKKFSDRVYKESCTPHCFATYMGASESLFRTFFDNTNWSYAVPATSEVRFDGRTKTYSVLYVDGVNGNFDETGNWSFNDEFAYLSDLIVAGHNVAVEFGQK